MANFFFFFQQEGKESRWTEALADRRESIISSGQPAFSTVLDLSLIPDDNDWSKVKYKGPFYADFDAGDDLPFVCDQFKSFLGKLDSELEFDLTQARLYASGGKGFHIEIPQECFMPKMPPAGTAWLPYIYREMAQAHIVDTLDLNVYTGKKGRQWRTVNVLRDNGNYKVPITLEEAMDMDEDMYREIIKAPRPLIVPTPPDVNSRLARLFDSAKDKVTTSLRHKKKRMEKANEFLDPWKKAKKTPPSILRLMHGEDIAEGAGFQSLAMQLAIYAVSMGMARKEFLDGCVGLIDNHVSDSYRYNNRQKRTEELGRMFDYMEENNFYDFDVGPIVRLLKPGTSIGDLGVLDREDKEDKPAKPVVTHDGDDDPAPETAPVYDVLKGVRKGFFMNSEGMFKQTGENTDAVSRAVLRNVEAFYDFESKNFSGYEFDIVVGGRKVARKMLGSDTFVSAVAMRKFFGGLQVAYQGGEAETAALLDIVSEKAERGGRVYSYPREGFFIIDHPELDDPTPVACYLTQDTYLCSYKEDDPLYFRLRYRPNEAVSTYLIDIHKAPTLGEEHKKYIHDLLDFNHPDVVFNLVGWFFAAYLRSHFLRAFQQFPVLQIFGEAGAGKTQSVYMASRLHWYKNDMGLDTAHSYTPFTLDNKVSTSHSAPAIIDEYKPRELRQARGKYEKLKDVIKNSYVGGNTGNRGTINRGGETSLGVIKSKCAAPLIFIGEAIENETAIIERCVFVKLVKDYQTPARSAAFHRLHDTDEGKAALSALGKFFMGQMFGLNLDSLAKEVNQIILDIKASMPSSDDKEVRAMAERMIFNIATVIYGWRNLQKVLRKVYGKEFDAKIDEMIAEKLDSSMSGEETKVSRRFGRSEISKVVSQIAMLSREQERPYELRLGKDYITGDDWVEFKVEKAYSLYRMYCGTTHEQPLFDNLDTFCVALSSYSPVIDHVCAASDLRDDGSNETIHRLDMNKLRKDGVQVFR